MPQNQFEGWLERVLFDPLTGKFLAAAIALLVIVALVRLLHRNLVRRVPELSSRYRLRKFITIGGYLVAALALSIIFSDRLGRLTVFFGIFGAGVAFALQEVIAAVAGWVAITVGRYYRFGDRILVSEVMGDVIDVGLLRTTIMECGQWVQADQYTGRIVTVSNALVLRQPIYNYSSDFPFLWDEITVPIRYGSDRDLARDLILRVAREEVGDYAAGARSNWEDVARRYLVEPETVEPVVTLVANDNWIAFTLRYVVEYKRRRWTQSVLFSRILEEIDRTDGRVVLASTTIQLVQPDTFDVRLRNDRSAAP